MRRKVFGSSTRDSDVDRDGDREEKEIGRCGFGHGRSLLKYRAMNQSTGWMRRTEKYQYDERRKEIDVGQSKQKQVDVYGRRPKA